MIPSLTRFARPLLLAGALVGAVAARAQTIPGIFQPLLGAQSGYVGPGDAVSGVIEWWGLRGYARSYATGSNNAATIRRASDNTTQAIKILADGSFDVATASSFCASTTCFITTLNGQVGGVNMTQATAANQPQLVFNCAGTLPCWQTARASNQFLKTTANISIPAPYSIAGFAKRTGSTTSFSVILSAGGGNPYLLFSSSANNICWASDSGCLNVSASDNSFHAAVGTQASGSGAPKAVYADGNSASSTATVANTNSTASVGCKQAAGGDCLDGQMTEAGLWNSALTSGQATSLIGNMNAYW